jgi:hypothetical protein
MTFTGLDHPDVQAAVVRIRALRQLTNDTGVKTYKSQSAILESLPSDVLASVAVLLIQDKVKGNDNDHTRR